MKNIFIHRTAEVSKKTIIGNDTKIWHYTQIREKVTIGQKCIIGRNVYIDFETSIGNNCKIQNNSLLYHKTILEDGVFIGPQVTITNDLTPRAINPKGELKTIADWTAGIVTIKYGASIGAGTIILPNVTIGKFAMVGAGSVVTHNVKDYALVYGNPAKEHGTVDENGRIIKRF